MSKKSGLGKFALGALVGAGLGVLFAPKKGSETREDLKNKIKELYEQAKDIDAKEVKEEITRKLKELEAEIKDLDKEKVLAIAKEKGEDIKVKAEELVQVAKNKATPVVESLAEEVRQKAIATTKNVLEKLENTDNEKI